MAYPPTSDLLDAANAGIRYFEVEDSLGSRALVRRQLAVADSAVLQALVEGEWVMPDPANVNQYVPAQLPPGGVAYCVASMTGTQNDVLESGGVTGLQGSYVGRTKVFEAAPTIAYAVGLPLTVDSVDIGGGEMRYGLTTDGVAGGNEVARVEFYDAANGVLVFTALPR